MESERRLSAPRSARSLAGMNVELPDWVHAGAGLEPGVGIDVGLSASPDDVGDFPAGSPVQRWVLGRYLLGRALARYLSRALLSVGLGLLAAAVLVDWAGVTGLAVLIGVLGLSVLAIRSIFTALLHRLTRAGLAPALEPRLRSLVADTGADVERELRRLKLPSHSWTFPLLVVRLAGRRRVQTLARLREFDVERVVPPARLDELLRLVPSRRG